MSCKHNKTWTIIWNARNATQSQWQLHLPLWSTERQKQDTIDDNDLTNKVLKRLIILYDAATQHLKHSGLQYRCDVRLPYAGLERISRLDVHYGMCPNQIDRQYFTVAHYLKLTSRLHSVTSVSCVGLEPHIIEDYTSAAIRSSLIRLHRVC